MEERAASPIRAEGRRAQSFYEALPFRSAVGETRRSCSAPLCWRYRHKTDADRRSPSTGRPWSQRNRRPTLFGFRVSPNWESKPGRI